MTASAPSLFTDEFFQNPYPALAHLRDAAPVHCVESEPRRVWLISRYADVRAAMSDPRLSRDYRWTLPPEQRESAPQPFEMMIITDPPEHTRLRRLVAKVFTPKRMEELRPRVVEIAADLIAALPDEGEVDILSSYASMLPVLVICELLGVSAEDRDRFMVWSNAMVDQTSMEESQAAGMNLAIYFNELIAAKREQPDDALISALIAESDDDRLSHDELIAMSMMLLLAGHETTVGLISSGLLALLTHPTERERIVAHPELMASAVEEFLRWESPIHTGAPFFTKEPVEYSGVTIPAGEEVKLCIGAANRDRAQFPDADELNLDAAGAGHIAFSYGIHFCLGAHLARVEGQEAIRALLVARPDMRLAVEPSALVYRRSTIARVLKALPVKLGA
jgi:cytochrome P450